MVERALITHLLKHLKYLDNHLAMSMMRRNGTTTRFIILEQGKKEIPLKEIPNKKKGNSRMRGINCFTLLNN